MMGSMAISDQGEWIPVITSCIKPFLFSLRSAGVLNGHTRGYTIGKKWHDILISFEYGMILAIVGWEIIRCNGLSFFQTNSLTFVLGRKRIGFLSIKQALLVIAEITPHAMEVPFASKVNIFTNKRDETIVNFQVNYCQLILSISCHDHMILKMLDWTVETSRCKHVIGLGMSG